MKASILILFGCGLAAQSVPPNTFTITDTSGSAGTRPFTISRVFAKGAIPQYARASIAGTPITTQCDVKTRWPDGSVQHALVSFLTNVNASAAVTVTFVNQSSGNNTGEMDRAAILASSWGAQIEATNGTLQTANARTIVTDWAGTGGDKRVQYWLKGSIATQIIAEDRSTALQYDMGWDSFKPLHPIFVVTLYPGYTSGSKVEMILENNWTTKLEDQTYSLALKTGQALGTTPYTKATFTHIAKSRWRKTFWSGSAPLAYKINHNAAYLSYTKAFPNWDFSITVPSGAITSDVNAYNASDKGDINGRGSWEQAMQSTGGRPDIGLVPAWYARYLYTMDTGLASLVAGYSEVAGYVPIHYRESSTTKVFDGAGAVNAFGYPLSLNARPTVWSNDTTYSGSAAGDRITPVGTATSGGWTWEIAHEPSMAYVPYILTGDWYFLEELYFWAGNALGASSPGFASYQRGDKFGYANRNIQTRGQGWVLRDLAHAAFAAPDGSNEKAYFTAMMQNNLQIEEGFHQITNGAFPPANAACPGYSPGAAADKWCFGKLTVGNNLANPLHYLNIGDDSAGCASGESSLVQPPDANATNPCDSPWMYGYKLNVMGHIQDLGFSAAALNQLTFRWLLHALTDSAYNPYRCCGYRIAVQHTNATFFQNYTDALNAFSTSFNDCGTVRNLRTYQGFVDACGGTSDSNVSGPGYPHIMKGAASYLAGLNITDGGLTGTAAWNWMIGHVCCQASTGANPQWVTLPRTAAAAPCDTNGDGVIDVADVQLTVNMALGVTACTAAGDLDGNGVCDVVDIQRVINTVLGGSCRVGP